MSGRSPSLTAVIGTWLIFLPAVIAFPIAIIRGGVRPLLLGAVLVVFALYAGVPISMTRRYLAGRKQNQ